MVDHNQSRPPITPIPLPLCVEEAEEWKVYLFIINCKLIPELLKLMSSVCHRSVDRWVFCLFFLPIFVAKASWSSLQSCEQPHLGNSYLGHSLPPPNLILVFFFNILLNEFIFIMMLLTPEPLHAHLAWSFKMTSGNQTINSLFSFFLNFELTSLHCNNLNGC